MCVLRACTPSTKWSFLTLLPPSEAHGVRCVQYGDLRITTQQAPYALHHGEDAYTPATRTVHETGVPTTARYTP